MEDVFLKNIDNDRNILKQFELLFFKTLDRMGINSSGSNYEIFIQELRVKYLNVFKKIESNLFTQNIYRYIGYLKKSFNNFGINSLKSNPPTFDAENGIVTNLADRLYCDYVFDSGSEVSEFFKQASHRLSDLESMIFYDMVNFSYTTQELADKYSVSCELMVNYKKQIQEKIIIIKESLD